MSWWVVGEERGRRDGFLEAGRAIHSPHPLGRRRKGRGRRGKNKNDVGDISPVSHTVGPTIPPTQNLIKGPPRDHPSRVYRQPREPNPEIPWPETSSPRPPPQNETPAWIRSGHPTVPLSVVAPDLAFLIYPSWLELTRSVIYTTFSCKSIDPSRAPKADPLVTRTSLDDVREHPVAARPSVTSDHNGAGSLNRRGTAELGFLNPRALSLMAIMPTRY
jgi:hypothetical protein